MAQKSNVSTRTDDSALMSIHYDITIVVDKVINVFFQNQRETLI